MGLVYRVRSGVSAAMSRLLGTLTHVETSEPVAALTFDDGPHPVYTPRILDVLKEHNARATFFMVGRAAEAHPELVERVAEEGHAIGNHSWDHPVLPLLGRRERHRQIRQCQKTLGRYGTNLFRPPFGSQTRPLRWDLLSLGYCPVVWNVVGFDWLDKDPEWMANHLVREIKPGSIVLLHDAVFRSMQETPIYARDHTISALSRVLAALRGRIQFVTVPELMRRGRPLFEDWVSMPAAQDVQKLRPMPTTI